MSSPTSTHRSHTRRRSTLKKDQVHGGMAPTEEPIDDFDDFAEEQDDFGDFDDGFHGSEEAAAEITEPAQQPPAQSIVCPPIALYITKLTCTALNRPRLNNLPPRPPLRARHPPRHPLPNHNTQPHHLPRPGRPNREQNRHLRNRPLPLPLVPTRRPTTPPTPKLDQVAHPPRLPRLPRRPGRPRRDPPSVFKTAETRPPVSIPSINLIRPNPPPRTPSPRETRWHRRTLPTNTRPNRHHSANPHQPPQRRSRAPTSRPRPLRRPPAMPNHRRSPKRANGWRTTLSYRRTRARDAARECRAGVLAETAGWAGW